MPSVLHWTLNRLGEKKGLLVIPFIPPAFSQLGLTLDRETDKNHFIETVKLPLFLLTAHTQKEL